MVIEVPGRDLWFANGHTLRLLFAKAQEVSYLNEGDRQALEAALYVKHLDLERLDEDRAVRLARAVEDAASELRSELREIGDELEDGLDPYHESLCAALAPLEESLHKWLLSVQKRSPSDADR